MIYVYMYIYIYIIYIYIYTVNLTTIYELIQSFFSHQPPLTAVTSPRCLSGRHLFKDVGEGQAIAAASPEPGQPNGPRPWFLGMVSGVYMVTRKNNLWIIYGLAIDYP